MFAKRSSTLIWAASAAMLAVLPAQAKAADTIQVGQAADTVCEIIMNSGMASECEVSGWDSAIDFWVDTSSVEARKLCALMTPWIAEQTDAFAGRTWQMRIFSPYTGDHPLAVCDLR
jgi:hypothetical protein